MNTKKSSVLCAFLLLAVLALPSISQWNHLAADHHQEVECSENSLHFHTEEINCALTATFTPPYTPNNLLVFTLLEVQEEPFHITKKEPLLTVNAKEYFQLRAPPFLLYFS